jgi:hypothetical protein
MLFLHKTLCCDAAGMEGYICRIRACFFLQTVLLRQDIEEQKLD